MIVWQLNDIMFEFESTFVVDLDDLRRFMYFELYKCPIGDVWKSGGHRMSIRSSLISFGNFLKMHSDMSVMYSRWFGSFKVILNVDKVSLWFCTQVLCRLTRLIRFAFLNEPLDHVGAIRINHFPFIRCILSKNQCSCNKRIGFRKERVEKCLKSFSRLVLRGMSFR